MRKRTRAKFTISGLLMCALSITLPASYGAERHPGVLESLETILKGQKSQDAKLAALIRSNPNRISSLSRVKSVALDHIFLRSILIHSDHRYIEMMKNDECGFYSLLENNLLRTSTGPINEVIISYVDSFKKSQVSIITKERFLKFMNKTKCKSNLDRSVSFEKKNLNKTLDGISFTVPKTHQQCTEIFQRWKNNPTTPYLCKIPVTIDWGKKMELLIDKNGDKLNSSKKTFYRRFIKDKEFYQSAINFYHRTYISNLCSNIADQESFCSLYLKDDIWAKVINGEKPKDYMRYTCNYLSPKHKDELTTLTRCRKKLMSSPALCSYRPNKKVQSLFPKTRCDDLSYALNRSKLRTNYQDCPEKIDNEGITNTFRILEHFNGDQKRPPKYGCSSNTNLSFAKLNIEYNNKSAWPLSICYVGPVDKKEICKPYVPGDAGDSSFSEPMLISKILQHLKNAPTSLQCKVVDKNQYRPGLLEYKTGCYIVYNRAKCTTLKCDREIYYKGREVKGIKYQGVPTFDYFVNSFKNEGYAIKTILEKRQKIRSTNIKNLTEIIYFLGLDDKSIIHGIGCAEDILPNFFQRYGLNQCTPMPFIIDGYSKEGMENMLITRLPVDDAHTPRVIEWKNIFTAVAFYQKLHPLRTWTMYGIKK